MAILVRATTTMPVVVVMVVAMMAMMMPGSVAESKVAGWDTCKSLPGATSVGGCGSPVAASIVHAAATSTTGCSLQKVEVREVNPWQRFQESAIEGGVPVVIRGSVASTWPALGRWDRPYLRTFLKGLELECRESNASRVFVPSGVRELQEPNRQVHALRGMTMEAFLDVLEGKEAAEAESGESSYVAPWLYFTGDLEDWGPVRRDVVQSPLSLAGEESRTMLWMGFPGVVANMHYDPSENFHAQIVGRKRWTLFPPEQWRCLKPWPALHAHYRQAQSEHVGGMCEACPACAGAGWTVDVEPGDVLYVPPFWFHRVEALSFAVSASVLSPSRQEMAGLELRAQGALPWTQRSVVKSAREAVLLARLAIEHLLEMVLADTDWASAEAFIKEAVVENRYGGSVGETVVATCGMAARKFGKHRCYASDRAHASQGQALSLRRRPIDMDALDRRAALWAAGVASILEDLVDESGVGVAEIVLADYLEELAKKAMGDVSCGALLFFRLCW